MAYSALSDELAARGSRWNNLKEFGSESRENVLRWSKLGTVHASGLTWTWCLLSNVECLKYYKANSLLGNCWHQKAKLRVVADYRYNPSGSPSLLVFITLSRADRKSAIWTLILRSLSASRPASEQIALMSAPDKSSFWLMNSSSSTSSLSDILEVWRLNILRLVFSVTRQPKQQWR